MEGYHCPCCQKFFVPKIFASDGGSTPCPHCGVKSHRCTGGKGNWGTPSSCKCSQGYTSSHIHLDPSEAFKCPSCAELIVPSNWSQSDGSINCPKCFTQCHRCTGGKGNWGGSIQCGCSSSSSEAFRCPSCKKIFTPRDHFLDGGSTNCTHCGANCHKCSDGTGKFGSPMDCSCWGKSWLVGDIPENSPEAYPCPSCMVVFTPLAKNKDGGSSTCPYCLTNSHKCVGGKGALGSPFGCVCHPKINPSEVTFRFPNAVPCPSCGKSFVPKETFMDGGSSKCVHCGISCHKCVDGKGFWGSPLNCPSCKKFMSMADLVEATPGWSSPFA